MNQDHNNNFSQVLPSSVQNSELIWSLVMRGLHWGVALAILSNLWLTDEGDKIHEYVGYTAGVFFVLRLLWGFVGSENRALWKNFFKFHNIKATLAYFVIWSLLIGLIITGYLMGTDRFFGDELVEEIHEYMSHAMIVLFVVHLSGLAIDSVQNKRKTFMAMITGRYKSS